MSTAEEGSRPADRAPGQPGCCPHLHEAVELVGRRWTGAILEVLRQSPRPLRFSEIAAAVPALSDRLCSERMKELEARGLVEREVHPGPPVRVTYALTEMGRALEPALSELKAWGQTWLASAPQGGPGAPHGGAGAGHPGHAKPTGGPASLR